MAVTSIAMHEGIERGASLVSASRVCIGFGNGKLPPKAKTVPNAKTQDSQGADIIDVVLVKLFEGPNAFPSSYVLRNSGLSIDYRARAQMLHEQKRTMPSYARPIVAVLLLVLGSLLARFGLIELIALGYGTIAWGFLLFFVIPVLTVGAYKVARGPTAAFRGGSR